MNSEVLKDAITVLVMEAVSTSELSVNFYETTRRNIREDIFLCIGCILVSHITIKFQKYVHIMCTLNIPTRG
jgi:hypothetical protein